MMLRIDIHHWFAMAAIFNPKWRPKYKFVQPIPIFFLAYLVPLDVDIVPIKFHQFLFGE
jgi:hypothetical protein